jgi:hypothetical protein
MQMVAIFLIGWAATGFVGTLLWHWAEGPAPRRLWGFVYPILLGPIGLFIGGLLALSELQFRGRYYR